MTKHLIIFLLFFSINALADTGKLTRSTGNFEFGYQEGNQLNISAHTELGYIDNYFYQESNKEATRYWLLGTSAFTQGMSDRHLAQLQFNLKKLSFDKFDEDNHTNLSVFSKYYYKFAVQQKLFVSASFEEQFEYRGTGLTQGYPFSVEKGDRKENGLLNIGYQYGDHLSVGKANIVVGRKFGKYVTRRHFSSSKDFESDFIHSELDYLLSGKTYLSARYEFADIDYQNQPTVSRQEHTLYTGVKWEVSELSHFALLLGAQKLEYVNDNQESVESFRWRANYTWSPLASLQLGFKSGRYNTEANEQLASYKVVDDYGFDANYTFNERLIFLLDLNYQEQAIVFQNSEREDEQVTISPIIQYQFNEWLKANFEVNYSKRASNFDQFDYDRRKIAVSIVITL